jgi:FHS family L-fucose permease-like MFS transporter
VAASNDILIPVFKKAMDLKQWQSQMVSFAFYVAYAVGAFLYFILSSIRKRDILNELGYRNGLALGLVISAIGTLLFIPASNAVSFPLFISGLFIVGLGFSLQQIAANPLAIRMGDPTKGNMRLSLAGGINNVGTTLGPVVVSFAIFGSSGSAAGDLDLTAVQTPYLALGAAFLLAAFFFKFSKVPDRIEETGKNEEGGIMKVLSYPQLAMGMIAIFVYVGVEVATAGNLGELMKQELDFGEHEIAPFVSLFWASLMIGRWASAAGAFNVSASMNRLLGVILPFVAFGIFLLVNHLAGHDLAPLYPYAFLVLLLIFADMMSRGNPIRQLLIYSLLGIAALITGMISNGMPSVFAMVAVGLFCSTLWPCIFTLAINGLGSLTNTGSSLLVMMIMGGGFISVLQGYLADPNILGIKASYSVGIFCFAYLAFYSFVVKKAFKNQGISISAEKINH